MVRVLNQVNSFYKVNRCFNTKTNKIVGFYVVVFTFNKTNFQPVNMYTVVSENKFMNIAEDIDVNPDKFSKFNINFSMMISKKGMFTY